MGGTSRINVEYEGRTYLDSKKKAVKKSTQISKMNLFLSKENEEIVRVSICPFTFRSIGYKTHDRAHQCWRQLVGEGMKGRAGKEKNSCSLLIKVYCEPITEQCVINLWVCLYLESAVEAGSPIIGDNGNCCADTKQNVVPFPLRPHQLTSSIPATLNFYEFWQYLFYWPRNDADIRNQKSIAWVKEII